MEAAASAEEVSVEAEPAGDFNEQCVNWETNNKLYLKL